MQKLCIFVGMTLFSYGGWYLGLQFGEFMTAFIVSGAFAILGVVAGWWVWKRFFMY